MKTADFVYITAAVGLYACFGLVGHFYGVPDTVMFVLWASCGSVQWIVLRKSAAWIRFHHLRSLRTETA